MLRALGAVVGLSMAVGVGASGQAVQARSTDYLFTTSVDDARAIWVNPAGLGAVMETSLMADLVLQLPEESDVRVSQWTIGFNSRGISVGFQRDRLVSDSSNQALRIGFGRGFPGGAFGLSFTLYGSDSTSRGWDFGLQYALVPSVRLAATVRNVGRPIVRSAKEPITGVAGAEWGTLGGALRLAAEALLSERIGASGFDPAYRGGLRLGIGGSLPLSGFAIADVNQDFDLARWTFGLSIGGVRQGLVVGTLPNSSVSTTNLLSFHGMATNRGDMLTRN